MGNYVDVKIKKLKENAVLPSRGSSYAAGYDLYACLDEESIVVPAHSTVKIGTGLAMAIQEGYWLGIYARSGLATKQGMRPANCVGVVDSDYRGEVIVAIHNDTDEGRLINNGDRIAQGIIHMQYDWVIDVVNELDETERADGGFGSTGTK